MSRPEGDGPRLLGALVRIADLLLTDTETHTWAGQVVKEAIAVLPTADAASLTLPGEDGRGVTLAASGPEAIRLDEAQYQADDGPCLRAMRAGVEVLVTDLTDGTWPKLAAACREHGVASILSLPLIDAGQPGALNLYSRRPGAFDDENEFGDARILARYAATINAARRYHHAITEVAQLHEALRSRAVIEQAKGMIMLRQRCTADEAFAILVRASQHSQYKLREIAARLVKSATSEDES